MNISINGIRRDMSFDILSRGGPWEDGDILGMFPFNCSILQIPATIVIFTRIDYFFILTQYSIRNLSNDWLIHVRVLLVM